MFRRSCAKKKTTMKAAAETMQLQFNFISTRAMNAPHVEHSKFHRILKWSKSLDYSSSNNLVILPQKLLKNYSLLSNLNNRDESTNNDRYIDSAQESTDKNCFDYDYKSENITKDR